MVFIYSLADSFSSFELSFALNFDFDYPASLAAGLTYYSGFFLGLDSFSSFFSLLSDVFLASCLASGKVFLTLFAAFGLDLFSSTLTGPFLVCLVGGRGSGSSLIFFLPPSSVGAACDFFLFFSSSSCFLVFLATLGDEGWPSYSSFFLCARVFMANLWRLGL